MTTDILDLIDNALFDAMSEDAMRWTPEVSGVGLSDDLTIRRWAPNADVPGGAVPGEWQFVGRVTQASQATLIEYQVERPDGNLLYQVTISGQCAIWPYFHDWRTGELHIGPHVINPPWVMRVNIRVRDDRGDSHWERWMVTDDQSRCTFFSR